MNKFEKKIAEAEILAEVFEDVENKISWLADTVAEYNKYYEERAKEVDDVNDYNLKSYEAIIAKTSAKIETLETIKKTIEKML